MNKTLVMVFTRNPELGKVKTRLAKTIGNEGALTIYKALLNHTENTIRKVNSDKAVFYSVSINDDDIWNNTIYQKHLQKGNDLGERMKNAFANAFKSGYNKVVIVASDLFDITSDHINEAFKQLDASDVVIGPSPDGGYYLLGMNYLHSQVFEQKEWGTETVLNATLKDMQNIDVHLLEEINDIDTFDDIKNIPELTGLLELVNR